MMLASEVPVTRGERLNIFLSETSAVAGRVVWSEQERCGVAFDAVVDGLALLRQLADEQRTEGYRPLRLAVRGRALLKNVDGALSVDLLNLSHWGVGFTHSGIIEPGKIFDFVIEGRPPKQGVVRWSRKGRGGMWLLAPFDRRDLESARRFHLHL